MCFGPSERSLSGDLVAETVWLSVTRRCFANVVPSPRCKGARTLAFLTCFTRPLSDTAGVSKPPTRSVKSGNPAQDGRARKPRFIELICEPGVDQFSSRTMHCGNPLLSLPLVVQVRLWDVAKSRELGRLSFMGHSHPVRSLASSSDGKLLVSGGEDHKVRARANAPRMG